MKNYKSGDTITFVGKNGTGTETDVIEEAFLSMDKSYHCYWVKGCHDLITEFMLVEENNE